MKNISIVILSFVSFALFAQKDNTLLYKISGKDLAKPSYIFGTVHITCDATLDASVLKALNETSQMYLELDMDDPQMQVNMMKSMSMKDGVTISSLISAEDYKLLDDYLMSKLKVPATVFNTYKPFMLSAVFMSTFLDCTPQSFENELVRISTEQKEPIFGLETVEEQMAIFDKIPYQLQAEELIASIKNDFQEDKRIFQMLMKSYASKDINQLQKLMEESPSKIITDYNHLLLKNRNKNWIALIEKISKDKPTFFGVGAAHLFGDHGVLSLLRRDGYRVDPVLN